MSRSTLPSTWSSLAHLLDPGVGDAENRIKDFKNALGCDRLSCTTYVANAFRLLLHAFAYRLLDGLRAHLKVVAPELGCAQFDTLRLRLLKVAAHVRQSVRRIAVALPSAFGLADVFVRVAARLGALTFTP
jgi:Transposase DDE domain group 1